MVLGAPKGRPDGVYGVVLFREVFEFKNELCHFLHFCFVGFSVSGEGGFYFYGFGFGNEAACFFGEVEEGASDLGDFYAGGDVGDKEEVFYGDEVGLVFVE